MVLDIPLTAYAGIIAVLGARQLTWSFHRSIYIYFMFLANLALLCWVTYVFYGQVLLPLDTVAYPHGVGFWDKTWLVWWARIAPLAVFACFTLNVLDIWKHMDGELHIDHDVSLKHDRVIQVIILPAFFSTMCLAATVPILKLIAGDVESTLVESPWATLQCRVAACNSTKASDLITPDISQDFALWRYESSMYVGDLFEAWVLFQFGKLILDQVGDKIKLIEEDLPPEIREDIEDAHAAVSSLTWVGLSTFIVLSLVQSCFAVLPVFGGDSTKLETIMNLLYIAGFISSSTVIYNLVIVEQAFHRHLKEMVPLLKFLSVKFLVSLCFAQKTVLIVFKYIYELGDSPVKNFVGAIPIIGDYLRFSVEQRDVFYASLVAYECLILGIMHHYVWKTSETWYVAKATERSRMSMASTMTGESANNVKDADDKKEVKETNVELIPQS